MKEITESNFCCLLAVDLTDEALVLQIVDGARQVYMDVYGDCQTRRHDLRMRPRCDKGLKNPKRSNSAQHSQAYKRFIEKRRNSVDMAL